MIFHINNMRNLFLCYNKRKKGDSMDFYEQLKNMSDDEIKAYLDEVIPELEEECRIESSKDPYDFSEFDEDYKEDSNNTIKRKR